MTRTLAGQSANITPIDFSKDDALGMLNMRRYPLSTMLLAMPESEWKTVGRKEFGVSLENRRTLQATATGETSATVWSFTNPENYFNVGDLVEEPSGAVSRVDSIGGSSINTTLISGTHTTFTGGEEVTVVSTAPAEGYDVGEAYDVDNDEETNYIHQFTEAIKMTDLFMNADLADTADPVARERMRKWENFQRQIERALWISKKGTPAGSVGWRMEGLREGLTANVNTIASASFDEDAWEAHMFNYIFAEPGDVVWGFCGNDMMARLYKFFRTKQFTMSQETVYGARLNVLQTSAGTVVWVPTDEFKTMGLSDNLFTLRMEQIRPVRYKNLGVRLIENADGPKAHKQQDEYAAVLSYQRGRKEYFSRLIITP